MTELAETEASTIWVVWSQMVTAMLEHQLKLINAHWQVCVDAAERMLQLPATRGSGPPRRTATAEELKQLEDLVAERIKCGLAPPREAYELPYRDRIDWAAFPEWARPCDPELFQGCSHEG